MDPLILNDLSFIHLKKPVQDVSKNDLPLPFSLIAVDTNLPSGASMREALRLANFSQNSLQELF
jgi:pyruvate/2-oxoglutarate/acetoin dehydrogenase E1 component